MLPPLHAYQAKVVDWMLGRETGYLAMDMGLGKTRCVIEYLRRTGEQAFVCAPLQVALHTWPNELQKWAPDLSFAVLHGPHKQARLTSGAQVLIINYDGLKWLAKQSRAPLSKRVLFLDEATYVKSHRAIRTKLLAAMRIHFSKCFCLSASPMPGGPIDLWAQFRVMDFGQSLGAKWTPFFNAFFTEGYGYTIDIKAGAREEIMSRVSESMVRLAADDYLELPPFIDNDVMVELPKPMRELYKQFRKDMALKVADEKHITAVNSAVLSAKLRQFLQGAIYDEEHKTHRIHALKMDAFEEVHASLHGEPHLVAIAFKFELDALRERYGSIPVIAGGVSQADRLYYLEEWNKGNIPLMAVHPAAVSHGVNLQDGGHYMTWLALTWSLEHYLQLNGRLRRQGQTKPVVLTRIMVKDTIDQKVAAALADKNTTQEDLFALLDGEE